MYNIENYRNMYSYTMITMFNNAQSICAPTTRTSKVTTGKIHNYAC